jgi:hypothetical protein
MVSKSRPIYPVMLQPGNLNKFNRRLFLNRGFNSTKMGNIHLWNNVCETCYTLKKISSSQKKLIMSNSSKAVVSFIVGAAVGVAVGYFLNSDKKDELLEKLKDQSDKLKDKWRKKKDQFQDELENELA